VVVELLLEETCLGVIKNPQSDMMGQQAALVRYANSFHSEKFVIIANGLVMSF